MEPNKTLYYVDSIHYPEAEGNEGRYTNNGLAQVSLLDVSENINEVKEPNDVIVSVPTNQLMFANGRKISDNNFVYYSANSQVPFENGNKDISALNLINRSSRLRKLLREKAMNHSIELLEADRFGGNNVKITSYHINVGHGNCTVILIEGGTFYILWMVDCGTTYYVKEPHLENIDDCFAEIANKLGVNKDQLHISLFMLTHLHGDHYNGLEMLFGQGYCNSHTQFFINLDYAVASPIYVRILDRINNEGCPVNTPIRNVDNERGVRYVPTVIFPDRRVFKNNPSFGHKSFYVESNTNNSSVVYFVDVGGRSMLFPGDMEKKELDLMTSSDKCKPFLCKTDYYCVSHHASITGHLDCKCLAPVHPFPTCIDCCRVNLGRAIVMGRDGAFSGIYNQTVINDFGQAIAYSEKDDKGNPVKCLILDWASNTCSYLY